MAKQVKEKAKKNIFKPVMIILLIISLVGNAVLFVLYNSQSEIAELYSDKYSEEYFHYNSITVETFEEMVANGEDFAVIVSRPNCRSCELFHEDVMEVTEELGIANEIYFLNVYYHRQDEAGWNAFKETYGFTGTPNYARFTDGAMVSKAEWIDDYDENLAGIKAWMEAQSDLWD